MRTTLGLLLSLSLSVSAAAAGTSQAIKLDNQKTGGQTISGTCGPATVRISDAEKESPVNSMGFDGSYAAITIQSGKSSLIISRDPNSDSGIFLQDRSKLHCVSTPTGPKLILATYCFARYCTPVDYRVIDPNTAKVIHKLNDMNECDAACAQKALGVPLPEELADR